MVKLNISNVVKMLGFGQAETQDENKYSVRFKHNTIDGTESPESKKAFTATIARLKSKLYKEQIKSQHLKTVFVEAVRRLAELEKSCHDEDKVQLQELRNWVAKEN